MRTIPTRAVAAGLAAAGLALSAGVFAQAPPDTINPAHYAEAPVAYIHGRIPVTRMDLGEFLIARGGADKLELVVNKKIIEFACAEKGVTVTQAEMEAALMADLEPMKIQKAEFVRVVLPRYGKTLYEWMEDVIKPRLLLTKLCQDRVKVAEADLRVQFEREFGEKRRCQIIMWPATDELHAITKVWDKVRGSQDEFDRAALAQANPNLAAARGQVKPVGRHLPAQDKAIEDAAFRLRPGEVSEIITTSQGYLVLKMHESIPAQAGETFDKHRQRLDKQAFEEKLSQQIPLYFAELKEKAKPTILFTGPAAWQMTKAPASGVQPASATDRVPSPGDGKK